MSQLIIKPRKSIVCLAHPLLAPYKIPIWLHSYLYITGPSYRYVHAGQGQGWGWMDAEQQAESVYCRLTSVLLDLETDLMIVGLGEEVTHRLGKQLLITNHQMSKSLLDTCPASDITSDTREF